MRREELRALGDLAGDAAAGIATQARDVHKSIAARVFGALGPAAAPVRAVHDRLSTGAYAAAAALTGAGVKGGAAAASLTRPVQAPSLADLSRGRLAVGAINGMWGDRLHRNQSALDTPMAVRVRGRDIALDPASLRSAFPDATPRLAVFIHGLCETEDAWRLGARRHVPYGQRLRTGLGYTPVYVRYNSGLHISHNGRRLAALMDETCANWPMEVAEVALIGHSMGGLVARGACHYAGSGSWRERVRHVFTLGAPHKGAPLERGANAVCHAASRVPELTPFATPIRVRSVGVKDLAYGYVVDADWEGHDPDAFWANTATVVPFLATANHYFVSASLTREPDAPVGRLLGDLLVLRASAWSQSRRGGRVQFPIDQYAHIGRATHFGLLNHPAVYGQIHEWLTGGEPQLSEPAASAGARAG
ncbi:MAG: lipase family alpha/beta hydrolase [Solirubrobacteraceae bacterium]